MDFRKGDFQRKDFHLMGKEVMGTNRFRPPFKAASSLQNEARFVMVLNGKSRLYVPTGQVNIQAPDGFLMKCDNFVNNWLENEDGSLSEVVVFIFYPELLKQIYGEHFPALFNAPSEEKHKAVERVEMNPLLQNFRDGLRLYFDSPQLITDEVLIIKIRELVTILLNSDTTGAVKAMLSNLFRTNEYEFKEIVHSHLFEDLKVEDLAFFAGLSLSSFKRKFKTVFGTSPNQYIKSKRLEKAKDLLESTDNRVSEIAYDTGFNDVAYFSRAFSQAYQHSPSEYRKLRLSGS